MDYWNEGDPVVIPGPFADPYGGPYRQVFGPPPTYNQATSNMAFNSSPMVTIDHQEAQEAVDESIEELELKLKLVKA